MKKLLAILAIVTIGVTATNTVVSCETNKDNDGNGGSDGDLPNKNFELSKTNIKMDTKNPAKIEITNFSVLNDDSLPKTFTYSENNIISATLSTIDKAILITPNSKVVPGEYTITAASKIHEIDILVIVEEIIASDQFELETNSLTIDVNTQKKVLIKNWDSLPDEARPNSFVYDKTDVVTAELDSANHSILIKAKEKAVDEVKITIKALNKKEQILTIKIANKQFDLSKESVITNIAAGNMTNGYIDPSIAIGAEGFEITNESIVDSFNLMNKTNFEINDFVINKIDNGNNGIGAIYTIEGSESDSKIVGETELTLNKDLDPKLYFANTNLGEIRLFKGAYDNLENIMNDSKNNKYKFSLAGIIFENVGAQNKQLEYLKANLVSGGTNPAGKQIMANSEVSTTTFKINNFPDLGGLFLKEQNVEFTFKFVIEDRITFYEALLENKRLQLEVGLIQNKSKSAQKEAKKAIYNQLSDEFKNKIKPEEFVEFTNLIFDKKSASSKEIVDVKVDVLPGSDKLYGHDGGAWIGYISATGFAAIGTGSGNLEDFESNKKLEDKYTKGMGTFSIGGALSGEFYQGHEVVDLIDKNTNQGYINNIDPQEINLGYELKIKLEGVEGKNLKYKSIEISSDNDQTDKKIIEENDGTKSLVITTRENESNIGEENITLKVNDNWQNQVSFKLSILEAPILDKDLESLELGVNEEKEILFGVKNLAKNSKVSVKTKSSKIVEVVGEIILENEKYKINLKGIKPGKTVITILINDKEISSFSANVSKNE